MIVNFFCTKCGAPMNSDDSRPTVFCTRCGSCESVPRDFNAPAPPQPSRVQPQYAPPQPSQVQPQYAPPQPPQYAPPQPPQQNAAPGQPNLVVNYNSIRADVKLILEVPAIKMRYFLESGMSLPLSLYPGQHRLVLQIGRKRYARSVFLPSGNQRAVIYASWDGRAHIAIEQPFVTAGYVQPAPVSQPQYAPPQPSQALQPQYAPPQPSQASQPQYAPPQPGYIAPPAPPVPAQLQAQTTDFRAPGEARQTEMIPADVPVGKVSEAPSPETPANSENPSHVEF